MEQNTLVFITKSLYTVFSKKQIHDMTVFLHSDSRPILPSKLVKNKGSFVHYCSTCYYSSDYYIYFFISIS